MIVLGGGDNGLLCAAQLAKAGANTLLLERRGNVAGNLITEEFQGPYRFDLTAPYAIMLGERAPCHRELGLAELGVAYVTPEVQIAFHHSDGRALVFHRDPEKSAAAIGRFASADAETFRRMYREFRDLSEEILIPSLSNSDAGDVSAALKDGPTPLAKRLSEVSQMSPVELIDSYAYESSEVREALLYLATFWGLAPDQRGVGHIASLWVYCLLNSSIVRGGNISVARALYQSFLESGGDSEYEVNVEQLLVEAGKLVGVRLESGREIRARAVVCAAGLEDEQPSPDDMARNLTAYGNTSLLTCHYGYRGEAPVYRSAAFDPDSNEAFIHVFGIQRPGDVKTVYQTVESGEIPAGHGRALCATQFDEFHAGFSHVHGPLQTLRFEVPAPAQLDSDSKTLRTSWRDAALATWRQYADNVVDGPLSYDNVITPTDIRRRLPGFKLAPHGENNVEGLYMGTGSTYPGGLIYLTTGSCAADRVARDIGFQLTARSG